MDAGNFSTAETAEIEAMKKTMEDEVEAKKKTRKDEVEARNKTRKDEAANEAASKIMEQIRALGYIPKYSEHRQLARTYHQAVKDGKISSLDQEEAKKLTAAQYGR